MLQSMGARRMSIPPQASKTKLFSKRSQRILQKQDSARRQRPKNKNIHATYFGALKLNAESRTRRGSQ